MSVDWSYYNDKRFDDLDEKYLPVRGEGETKATQIVTAINKLIYKWYNDGDFVVLDHNFLHEECCNDLSSYANWLLLHARAVELLDVRTARTEGDYEDILQRLADAFLDEELLSMADKQPKVGTIYKCSGPLSAPEADGYEDDDDDYYEDEWEDDEEEDA